MKIRKGDIVKVLYGKDASKTGKVLSVNPIKKSILVEGVNMFKKHIKGDGQSKKSEIVEVTKSVQSSKVMLVCPNCNKSVRIGMKLEGKNYIRVCKKCGKGLDAVKTVAPKKEEKVEVKKVVKAKAKTKSVKTSKK